MSALSKDLEKISNAMRADVLKMVYQARAGHVAGPLSSAEIFAVLYLSGLVKITPENPRSEERDRIVLSCGHYAPILYAALSRAGYFSPQMLLSFGQTDSLLPLHPERIVGVETAPGVEASSGPLGQGISVAVGMALSLKLRYGERPQKETPRVYAILSDGEMQEGQVWEALMFAVRRQLDNLIVIIDKNGVQIGHYLSEIYSMGRLSSMLEAFGLSVLETNGNSVERVIKILQKAQNMQGGPVAIVAQTVASCGVSFMENDPKWHDKVPSEDELNRALEELGNYV